MMAPNKSIDDFSDDKFELLDLLLQEEGLGVPPSGPVITRRTVDTPAYASFAQDRQWFLSRLQPDSPFYNVYNAVRFKGALRVEILEQSLNELVRRHETLRTRFEMVDDQVIQVIEAHHPLTLPVIDLSSLPEAERENKAMELAQAESARPFNLSQGPLFRVFLMKLDNSHHIMMLNVHHIVSDEWSFDIIWRELSSLYGAYGQGQTSPLPELPIQYTDYAVWQRNMLQGEVLENQLAYWKQQLGGPLPVLELYTDYPRPAVQSYNGATEVLVISPKLSEAIRKIGQQVGATPFMTLFAAFAALLSRYSGQEDILVGTPIANRGQTEVEGLIGFFVNTLVLRANLAGNPTFKEFLERVREMALEAYDHQELPFEKLVEQLQPERDPSRNPIFQVMFDIQTHDQADDFGDLTTSALEIDNATAHFDLSVSLQDTPAGLLAEANYNTDLFTAPTMERLLTHFETLLAGIAANPSRRLSELPLLTEGEQRQLLEEWNNTATEFPREITVHQLFEAQAAQTPEAVAVIYQGQQLTYRALNRRANQLAHHLRALGVGPDQLVGICLTRSMEMVVGLWGILKAGGAYVPLDPAYPAERLEFMLTDSQATVLVTEESLRTVLPTTGAQVVCLDSDWAAIARRPQDNPASLAGPDNWVYSIYTSGSTGIPKGVLIQHRALVNHNLAIAGYYALQSADRVLQFASLSFDVNAEEVYPTLLSGATLVLGNETALADYTKFSAFVASEQVTVLNLPSPYWHEWVGELVQTGTKPPSTLRLVVVGSDRTSARILATWREMVGDGVRWCNAYGSTEVTITNTIYESPHGQSVPGGTTVPIGRPIANTTLYILDKYLNPVPLGVPGELYIGGAGLAQGYLNRAELTQEKFVRHPFEAGERLYRTGDLVRYLPDGNVEILGRIDHQVKIRGFRIELGEIEALLNQQPGVAKGLVIVREDSPGDKRLTAYVVPVRDQEPEIGSLRAALSEKLPEYMLPAAYVMLEALPLTPNGKIDLKALPEPEHNRQDTGETFVAPADELELQLAKIWERTLKVQPIGVNDNFFALGGHSLMAVQIFAQIEKIFKQNLPLATLFQAPTIAQLANLMRDSGWEPSWDSLVPIQPNGSNPPLFCIHAVGGNILSLSSLAKHLGPDQPFYGLQSKGLDGKPVPPTRLEETAAYYLEEIRTIQPKGPYFLTGQSSGGVIAFEMAQQLYAQNEEVALLALIDTFRPGHYEKLKSSISLKYKVSFYLKDIYQNGIPRLWQRVGRRLRSSRLWVRSKTVKTTNRFYIIMGRDLPHNRRYEEVEDIIEQAAEDYLVNSYPGSMILFRSSEHTKAYIDNWLDPDRGWGGVALGGLEICEIPGKHNLEQEPSVGLLAEKLKMYLAQKQG
jgi:aspartate racemase